MESFLQDLRYALRSIRRRPGFAAVVVLTLGIGIGANSAIFSVVNGVLLRPLPYREPERLVTLWTMLSQFGKETASLPDFKDWRARSTSFSDVAAMANSTFGVTGDGEPERVPAAYVTANFFQTLGVPLQAGRGFTPEEETRGHGSVVVVSHGFWRRQFGGRPTLVGETIRLSGRPYTVVGIAPPGFRLLERAELWVPLPTDNAEAPRRGDYLTVVARLKPGVPLQRARQDMAAVAKQLEAEYPQTNEKVGAAVIPLHEEIVGDVRQALLVFMGAVALVLLIACANVANLLLARSAARAREVAVRSALGAGRGRLARQLLTESVVLALAGAGLGLLLAVWGVGALQQASPSNMPRLEAIGVDGRVVAFTLGVSVLVGLLFGLAPALRLSGDALGAGLRDGTRTLTGAGGLRDPRGLLVMAEVSLAVLLLAGAGLLVRSFERLQRVDVGISAANVLTGEMVLPSVKYPEPAQQLAFFDRLRETVRAAPGVREVAFVSEVPLTAGASYLSFDIDGRPQPPAGTSQDAQRYIASPEYFQVMGIRLVAGRAFTAADRVGAPPVIVISQTMARRFWRGQDPLGARISFGDTMRTIVGVVGDTRQEKVADEPYPQAYIPLAQLARRPVTVVVRTDGDPLAAAGTLRQAVKGLDPELPLANVSSMEQRVASSLAQPRVNTVLLAIFAVVALVLASVGIYGVTSYGVAQRTREIGVRMALGARPGEVLRLVVRQGMTPVAVGLVLGVIGALLATRLMTTLLYGVTAADPTTYAAIVVILGAVAMLAAVVPARRAARVDPVTALRAD